jgi:hypothetical protein
MDDMLWQTSIQGMPCGEKDFAEFWRIRNRKRRMFAPTYNGLSDRDRFCGTVSVLVRTGGADRDEES